MKLKALLLEAARWIAVFAAIVYLVVLLGGNKVSNADFSQVSGAVMDAADTANMTKAENHCIIFI